MTDDRPFSEVVDEKHKEEQARARAVALFTRMTGAEIPCRVEARHGETEKTMTYVVTIGGAGTIDLDKAMTFLPVTGWRSVLTYSGVEFHQIPEDAE